LFSKRKEEDVNNTKTSNPDGFEQIDPPIRVLDCFLSSKSNHHYPFPLKDSISSLFFPFSKRKEFVSKFRLQFG